jgi:mono/diheme cytochrome c family protein
LGTPELESHYARSSGPSDVILVTDLRETAHRPLWARGIVSVKLNVLRLKGAIFFTSRTAGCALRHSAQEVEAIQQRVRKENPMFIQRLSGAFAALILLTCVAAAQDQTQDQGKVIKHVTVKNTSAASGKEMYTSYCAVCHGIDGKGDGPAASALKAPPTDLTTLSMNNGGKFPSLKISAAIRGDANVPAHGSKDMPVWGSLFREMSQGHEGEVQQRVANLTKYIESLQAK